MKMEAEYFETTPPISFDRFHEDSEIRTKMTSKLGLAQPKSSSYKKKQGPIWNQRPLKRWRPL